jgi:hypothetical protein
MTDSTARLALPYLAPGQAQKEITHNEALARLYLLLAGVVEATDTIVPPDAPQPGQAWLLGAAPTGAWSDQPHAIAGWTDSGWRFVAPVEGLCVRVRGSGLEARFHDGAWELGSVDAVQLRVNGVQVVGSRQPAVPDPVGGSVVDLIARETIGSILSVLRAHGLIA